MGSNCGILDCRQNCGPLVTKMRKEHLPPGRQVPLKKLNDGSIEFAMEFAAIKACRVGINWSRHIAGREKGIMVGSGDRAKVERMGKVFPQDRALLVKNIFRPYP